jgi:hypothetical protein
MDATQLKEVLDKHYLWTRMLPGGSRANLSGADLSGADLSGANLTGADLSRANLSGADLSGAYLSGALNVPDKFLKGRQIVPEVGAFQGFKKAWVDGRSAVVHIEIPADAARVGGVIGRKCRASKAVVLGFFDTKEEPLPEATHAISQHDGRFRYPLGEEVVPANGFSESLVEECAAGIHFFLTFAEAAEY